MPPGLRRSKSLPQFREAALKIVAVFRPFLACRRIRVFRFQRRESAEIFPRFSLPHLAGDVLEFFELAIVIGVAIHYGFGESLGILHCRVVNRLALGYQPGAEVHESVVRAAASDYVGGSPKVPVVRLGHALIKTPLKADYLVGSQLLEGRAKSCDLSVLSAVLFGGFINDAPEVFLVHKRCPSPPRNASTNAPLTGLFRINARKLTVCATWYLPD